MVGISVFFAVQGIFVLYVTVMHKLCRVWVDKAVVNTACHIKLSYDLAVLINTLAQAIEPFRVFFAVVIAAGKEDVVLDGFVPE